MTDRRLHPALPVTAQRGFTFVELMVTLSVLAVLLAIAVPSLRELIAKKRVESIARELSTDVRYLRTQATQRQSRVRIAFGSNTDATCYVMYGLGDSSFNCDCARSDGLPPCGNSDSVEYKTVLIRRDRGVVLSATPVRLTLAGATGLPMADSINALATIQATVQGTGIGGAIRVYTSNDNLIVPRVCSVSGHEGSMPQCPQ
jgi:prepilin-type N-terminal cleavage/methylation domain-containing protein